MKALVALTITLLSLNALAISTNTTWSARGERFKYVGKQIKISGFSSKEQAVNGALDLVADMTSGTPSKTAKAKFRNAITLWDSDNKCASSFSNARVVMGEMAKGRYEVQGIKVASTFNGQGVENYSVTLRMYAPCVLKDRD
jgi:hypothetical protein